MVEYDVVVVVHHDSEGVAQDQAAPHDNIAHPTSEMFLYFPRQDDQRYLSEHSEKGPGLQDKQTLDQNIGGKYKP